MLAGLGVSTFATGCFEDVLALRAARVRGKILLFASQAPEFTNEVMLADVVPTVCNLETAAAASIAASSPTAVFVKVDCGLGRFGVDVDEAFDFVRTVAALPRIVVEGLYTHLPFTDLQGRNWAAAQVQRFGTLRDALAGAGIHIPVTQALGSAGLLAGLDDRGCTAVCPGHVLYGLAPVSREVSSCSQFRPVLQRIQTHVVHLSHHVRARSAGISGTRNYAAGSRTGVVPLGLVDGYRPARSGHAEMLVRGHRVPVLSTSLESSTLDLTGVPTVSLGDPVLALGEDGGERITLGDMAAWQDTRELQVLMEFTGRMPITYVGACPDCLGRRRQYRDQSAVSRGGQRSSGRTVKSLVEHSRRDDRGAPPRNSRREARIIRDGPCKLTDSMRGRHGTC